MKIILSILYNTTFGKSVFTYVYLSTTAIVIQNANQNNISFLESLLSNVPAQVLYVLGIIYAIVVVLKFVSKAYKEHKINLFEIRITAEELNQAKAHTKQEENKNII